MSIKVVSFSYVYLDFDRTSLLLNTFSKKDRPHFYLSSKAQIFIFIIELPRILILVTVLKARRGSLRIKE